jgi:hypothetical protein
VREINGAKRHIDKRTNLNSIYLKLEKRGNRYTAYFSGNGESWTQVGAFDAALKDLQIGLYANSGLYEAGGRHGQVPADFDFFQLVRLK